MLYPMDALPANPKPYKNSYLLLDNRLYYVTPDGAVLTKALVPPESLFTFHTDLIEQGQSIEVTSRWMEELVELNPGHKPKGMVQPPSALTQLKNKLKSIFFERLEKNSTDEQVLAALATEERFARDYPGLKAVLGTIFSLQNGDDKHGALALFRNINSDRNTSQAGDFFSQIDKQYGYFSTTPDAGKLQAVFTRLAAACRSMIVLFEQNNTPEDDMAWQYAYFLMALLTAPEDLHLNQEQLFHTLAAKTHALLSTVDDDKPFHEAMLVKLTLPHARDMSDRAGWVKLIVQEGVKAFPSLAIAKKIERKIKSRESGEQKSDVLRAPKQMPWQRFVPITGPRKILNLRRCAIATRYRKFALMRLWIIWPVAGPKRKVIHCLIRLSGVRAKTRATYG